MENKRILLSGLLGGFITAIFSAVPYLSFINCFCCLGIMLGGMVALWYFDHSSGSAHIITSAQAVTIGITTGIISAFISLFISWMVYLKLGNWELRFLTTLLQQMEDVSIDMEDLLQKLEEQAAAGFIWTSTLLTNLFIHPLFCLIGALLARLFLNKRPAG